MWSLNPKVDCLEGGLHRVGNERIPKEIIKMLNAILYKALNSLLWDTEVLGASAWVRPLVEMGARRNARWFSWQFIGTDSLRN